MNNCRQVSLRAQRSNLLICLLTSVICLLACAPAYAGLGVSISGTPTADWAIGDIRSSNVTTTATDRWTLTNSGDVPASIYIKVAGTNWSPGSAAAVNTFVLKYAASGSSNWSSAITNSGNGIWLRLLGTSAGNTTMDFGLRFESPSSGSAASDTMTVTLTAQYFYVADGEWGTLLSGELVCVGTAGGYLIWPYSKDGLGCSLNGLKQWKDEATDGGPAWNAETFVYDYTAGGCASHCAKANYPAFSWAEDLDWQGYTDWRLPTKDELKQLYDYGLTYITYTSNIYWSATEASTCSAYGVSFINGSLYGGCGGAYDGLKTLSYYVRAVRSGQW